MSPSAERQVRGQAWNNAYHQAGLTLDNLDNDDQLRQELDDARSQLVAVFEHQVALETATQFSEAGDDEDNDNAQAFEELEEDEQVVRAADSLRRLTVFQREMMAEFIVTTGRPPIAVRVSARLALLFLARAGYDLRRALEVFEDGVVRGDEEILRDAEGEEERLGRTVEDEEEEIQQQEAAGTTAPVQPRTKLATEKQVCLLIRIFPLDPSPCICGLD